MQTLNELLSVDDALGLDLVNVCFEHCLKRGTQGLLWELELSKDLFHLYDGDASTAFCVGLLQRVVQLQLLKVHFSDIDRVEEDLVLNSACLIAVQLAHYQLELTRQNRHVRLCQALLKLLVAERAPTCDVLRLQALLKQNEVVRGHSLAEVRQHGLSQFHFAHSGVHVCNGLLANRLLRQRLMILNPRVVERLVRREALVHVLLYQTLQELFRLR